MLTLGKACLWLAFALAVAGIATSLYSARTGTRSTAAVLARRAVYAMAAAIAVAFVILEVAFARTDLSFAVVAGHSSTTTPLFYRLTAMWSSQSGSLLLWLFLLSIWSTAVVAFARRKTPELAPYATATLLAFAAFFCGLLVFMESPFAAMNPVPQEGGGLNPLLRHPSMMIHPPMLYSGYTLFTIPFAFAVAALATKRVGMEWIRLIRPFALAAWLALGIGIILGARWSYAELGWGGYWGWDPVENAALLPWLIGTAFLHSGLIQEKRGMLKRWNVCLVLASGILAILGTLVVRSGVLTSIHAFGASTLGIPFLAFITVLIVGSFALVIARAKHLHSSGKLESMFSKEGVFLLNNLVLVGLCFVVFWGTFLPLISEAVTGTAVSVGPSWFNRYVVPLALVLVLLAGFGPVIAWRRASLPALAAAAAKPALAAVLVIGVIAVPTGAFRSPVALLLFGLAAFSISVVIQEFARGAAARRALTGESTARALFGLVQRNRRRYGGYIVHIGIAVLFIGVAASATFQKVEDVRLKPGQAATIKQHEFKYERATARLVAAKNGRLERIDLGSVLSVRRNGGSPKKLIAMRSYFPSGDPNLGPLSRFFEGESTSEVGLKAGFTRDIWAAMAPDLTKMREQVREGDRVFKAAKSLPEAERNAALVLALEGLANSFKEPGAGLASFRLMVSPLVTWIWLGAIILLCGGVVALVPTRRLRGEDDDTIHPEPPAATVERDQTPAIR